MDGGGVGGSLLGGGFLPVEGVQQIFDWCGDSPHTSQWGQSWIINSRIFSLVHRVRRNINTLHKEETLFEIIMELCNLRFEKINISEVVTEPVIKKVIRKDLLKTLAERALVNNLLECLHTAKILSYDFGEDQSYKNFFIFTNLSWKRKKMCSLTLTFLYCTCLHIYNFLSLMIKFFFNT